jgi:hypothetical protein
MISLGELPPEILNIIITFSNLNEIALLSCTDTKIGKEASKHLNKLKILFTSLISLQQHYCGKQHLQYEKCLDTQNIKIRLISGHLVQNEKQNDVLILKPILTDKEKTEKLNVEKMKIKTTVDLVPEISSESKDLTVIPLLGGFYYTTMSDTSVEYSESTYWFKDNNLVNVAIFPIKKISIEINNDSNISEESKKRIFLSAELANKFYCNIAKPENIMKLENTINVNKLKFN